MEKDSKFMLLAVIVVLTLSITPIMCEAGSWTGTLEEAAEAEAGRQQVLASMTRIPNPQGHPDPDFRLHCRIEQ
jgi:hypothetical protein